MSLGLKIITFGLTDRRAGQVVTGTLDASNPIANAFDLNPNTMTRVDNPADSWSVDIDLGADAVGQADGVYLFIRNYAELATDAACYVERWYSSDGITYSPAVGAIWLCGKSSPHAFDYWGAGTGQQGWRYYRLIFRPTLVNGISVEIGAIAIGRAYWIQRGFQRPRVEDVVEVGGFLIVDVAARKSQLP